MVNAPSTSSRRRRFWCGVVVLACIAAVPLAPPSGLLLAAGSAIAVVAAMLRWSSGRVTLVRAALAAVAVSVLIDAVYFGPPGLGWYWLPFEFTAFLALLGRTTRHAPGRQMVQVSGAVALALVLLPARFILRADPPAWDEAVLAGAVSVFPAACAVGIGWYLRAQDGRRARAVERARAQQRLDVARDLHDFVAHELTGIVLEVQAALVDERDFDRDETRSLLGRLEVAGVRALDSMDRTLNALRAPGGDSAADEAPARVYGLADLPGVVQRFTESGSVGAELELADGVAGTLPPEIESTVYRIVVEALTNVRRHASTADTVTVAVSAGRTEGIEVRVTNSATRDAAPAPTRPGGGTGLVGLAERTEALGGRFESGPTDGGWQVRATFSSPRTAG